MSTVILDTITGKSTATTITIGSTPVVSASANSMTIRGEGSAQTSIQQGLLKAWYQFDGTGTVNFRDSFNMSGTTDGGTGTYANAYTTNMGSTNYAILTGGVAQTDIGTQSNSTDHHDILGRQGFDSTTVDVDPFYIGVAGDLA
tara:strand:+ start:303 stop:734 length:432 start_codon:yes stop_codon:yes gene_type:complete